MPGSKQSKINEPPLLSVQVRGKNTHTHTLGEEKQQDRVLLSSSIERGEACLAVCGSESNYQSLTFINRLEQVNFLEEEVDVMSEFLDYIMII